MEHGPFAELLEEINTLESIQKEYDSQAERILKIGFKDFLTKNSVVKALRWTQYTPGFNDGDACEFTVSDLQVFFEDPKDDSDDEGIDLYSIKGNLKKYNLDAETFKVLEAIGDSLNDMEKPLQRLYGDGSQVTVTSKKIKVTDYDCGF